MRLTTVTLLYTQRETTALQTSAAFNSCHLLGPGIMLDEIVSWMGELCRPSADWLRVVGWSIEKVEETGWSLLPY